MDGFGQLVYVLASHAGDTDTATLHKVDVVILN